MSWNVTLPQGTPENFRHMALKFLADTADAALQGGQARDEAVAATEIASDIVESPHLLGGDNSTIFSASIYGHKNAGPDDPTPDTMTIAVTRVSASTRPAPDIQITEPASPTNA